MEQNSNIIGQIDLLGFPEARHVRPGEAIGEEGVFIPRSANPTIFFCTAGRRVLSDGRTLPPRERAYLDLELHSTPENRYGNDFYVRASVGKSNRESLGLTDEEIKAATPIIGNCRYVRREEERPAPVQTQGAVSYAPTPSPIQSYDGPDMPDFGDDDDEDIF